VPKETRSSESGIVNGTIAPFADECQRRENGSITAFYYDQTPEEAAKDDFSVFRKMRCSDQLSTGVMSYITERPNNYGPFDLPAAHVFKIRDGKIYNIEAIGYLAAHGIKNGWE
jgi:hypothetical protein